MQEDVLTPAVEHDEDYVETDIFLWANNLVQIKEELSIELFMFNKNFTMYRTPRGKTLEGQLHALFLDEILEYVLAGADEGLLVRAFEDAEAQENVLMKTRLKNVDKAREILGWLRTQEQEIEQFTDEEHDIKRLKGVLARVTHKDLEQPFYVIKMLPPSNIMKGNVGWMLRGGKFLPFDAEGAMRIPGDNQLLIIGQDLFAFNQSKLEQLFGYNAKKHSVAEKKIAEIEGNFRLSFADGMNLDGMIKGKKTLINKLQKLDITNIKQNELIDHADEMGLELMTDDDGSIIIMDQRDLTKFINLLNDDYVESNMTGLRYEVKSKKPLKISEEDINPNHYLEK